MVGGLVDCVWDIIVVVLCWWFLAGVFYGVLTFRQTLHHAMSAPVPKSVPPVNSVMKIMRNAGACSCAGSVPKTATVNANMVINIRPVATSLNATGEWATLRTRTVAATSRAKYTLSNRNSIGSHGGSCLPIKKITWSSTTKSVVAMSAFRALKAS